MFNYTLNRFSERLVRDFRDKPGCNLSTFNQAKAVLDGGYIGESANSANPSTTGRETLIIKISSRNLIHNSPCKMPKRITNVNDALLPEIVHKHRDQKSASMTDIGKSIQDTTAIQCVGKGQNKYHL
jgi:hypothetical protein